jgi:hypothetical protein
MNDLLDKDAAVDSWGRHAATALRRSYAAQPVPPLAAMSARPAIGWKRPAFAFATVALLLVGLVAIARRDNT